MSPTPWRAVVTVVLLVLAVSPIILLAGRTLSGGAPPSMPLVIVLVVAYGIGVGIFAVPWIPHLRTWRAAARLRHRYRESTVVPVLDLAISVQAHNARGLVPLGTEAVVVAELGSVIVSAIDANLSEIWRSTPNATIDIDLVAADRPNAMNRGLSRISVRSSGDEVRFSVLTATPVTRFRASEDRLATAIESLRAVVSPTASRAVADRPRRG